MGNWVLLRGQGNEKKGSAFEDEASFGGVRVGESDRRLWWSEFWGGGFRVIGRNWWVGREGEKKNGHERMRMAFMAVENLEGDNVGT